MITIRDVRAISTAPDGINLTVVKVETSEPGLYGLGCATFAYRHLAVECVVNEYFVPLLRGRDVSRIGDIWQLLNVNSYWRNGPVTNNAVSGVDMALWDIKGKLANMPVYDLLGGKCREGAAIYRHADGRDYHEIIDNVLRHSDSGVRHIRIQHGGYGGRNIKDYAPEGSPHGYYLDPDEYCRDTVAMFEHVRSKLGFKLELLHDVHERIPPFEAVRLAKNLEPYRLFFLEDALSPEQGDYFRMIRAQSSTPLANGELYNNPSEYEKLISNRLIDFIRVHISQIGGLTPAKKLAAFCEAFGVRTAWHGPGDVSPVGHAANVHLDLCCHNFGIQEWAGISERQREIFPGSPQDRRGYAYVNDKPGWGVDIDEQLAVKYPAVNTVTEWTQTRLPDGTMQQP